MCAGVIGASLPQGPPILEGHGMLAYMQQRHNILPVAEFLARYAWVISFGTGGFGTVSR